jgi:aldose 1-epimerase
MKMVVANRKQRTLETRITTMIKSRFPFLLFLVVMAACACNRKTHSVTKSFQTANAGVLQTPWGEADGKAVFLYTLTNNAGDQVGVTNYGCIVTSWHTKDKAGTQSNIVLGFDNLQSYRDKSPLYGAAVGRYANRIANARFAINGTTYNLVANNGKNHIHGGTKGFDKQVWEGAAATDGTASVTLTYRSPDGEEGYPGNLTATVTYTLTDSNELKIDYTAATDKATPVNLTNHSYFNLTGDVNHTVLNHVLQVHAGRYTPADEAKIPTGEIAPVTGTPLDFRQPRSIGERIALITNGYDHNFVLDDTGTALKHTAMLWDSVSGRKMDVYTTEPGVQLYTGNFLDGSIKTPDGKPVKKHAGLCLETQHFPDSPNNPRFPTTLLQPGTVYRSTTVYKVSLGF